MRDFEHHNARSLREAVKLLARHKGKAKVNAGGTDLLSALKDGAIREFPAAVINIKTIQGLDYVRNGKKGLRIGALARLADIAASPLVNEQCKLLADAAHSVATPQIRNMATIGGNLAQDVRCWFYRYPDHIGGPMVCLRKGGRFCSAPAGDNRYHSIFGPAPLTQSPTTTESKSIGDLSAHPGRVRKGCFAVNPSDVAAALVALDADVITTRRCLSALRFFKATAMTSTVLQEDEIIKEIRIPRLPAAARQRYEKFTLRKPIDFAVVSVASVMTIANGICQDARIVLAAVAPDPMRASKAEELIRGRAVDEDIAAAAAELAVAGARPLKMNDYKVEIARVLVKRAILG